MIVEGKKLGGRYEIVSRVGGGGMAIVYKARDVLLNRHVAIKVLNESLSNDSEFIRRFSREAQAAASLSHPNVVNVYDVGRDGYAHYIVMELVEGPTLKEYIQDNGPLSTEEASAVAVQICEGLAHAHDNQIVHRDIKPHNILLGSKGRVKVTDFGIARAASSSTITQKGSVMGSVHYFSPEQARGGAIGEKSDIYSLGVVLYEMITGELPFDGDSAISIALKHLQDPVDNPQRYNKELDEAFVGIVLKALEKDPVERFSSARAMMQEIKSVVKSDYPLEIGWLKQIKRSERASELENEAYPASVKKGEEEAQLEPNEKLGAHTVMNLNRLRGLPADKNKTLFQKTMVWIDEVQQKLPLWQKLIFGCFTVGLIFVIFIGGMNLILGLRADTKNGTSFFSSKPIAIPHFSDEVEAKRWLERNGFPSPEIQYKQKDGVAGGHVFMQEPVAGQKVDTDTKVVLYIGTVKDPVVVENYIGQWESRANSNAYRIEKIYCPGPGERAHVFAQQPKAGEKIEKGGTVKVWISIPGATCKVPPPAA